MSLRVLPRRAALTGARALFIGALIFTIVEALLPAKRAVSLFPWDKATHFSAFYILFLLAAAAFPAARLAVVAIFLSAVGAAIEIAQALPAVHRDGDFFDWVADTVGVCAGLAPVLLARWRIWNSTAKARDPV